MIVFCKCAHMYVRVVCVWVTFVIPTHIHNNNREEYCPIRAYRHASQKQIVYHSKRTKPKRNKKKTSTTHALHNWYSENGFTTFSTQYPPHRYPSNDNKFIENIVEQSTQNFFFVFQSLSPLTSKRKKNNKNMLQNITSQNGTNARRWKYFCEFLLLLVYVRCSILPTTQNFLLLINICYFRQYLVLGNNLQTKCSTNSTTAKVVEEKENGKLHLSNVQRSCLYLP